VIPPFCFADCDNSGAVDFADLLCFLNRFERAQDPRTNPIDFFYCDLAPDDTIDFNDFLAFLNLYTRGCPR
jgi:Ca2+-binding EF-hand superfamily protein